MARAAEAVSATFFTFPAAGLPDRDVARASRALELALRKNPRIRLQTPDKLLAQSSGDNPRKEIRAARENCQLGIASLRGGRASDAAASLRQCISELIDILPFIRKNELSSAMLALGVAYAEMGARGKAAETFARLLVWRPSITYDTIAFSPQHAPLLQRARKEVARRKRGSVEITSTPPGAKTYVDGAFVGVTPTVVWGLTVGQHYATFRKAGFVKAAQVVTVSPREQTQWTQPLKRSGKFLLVKQALDAALGGLGNAKTTEAMNDLGRVLFVQQLIFVRIRKAAAGKLNADGYLYDLRTKMRLNRVQLLLGPKDPASFAKLAELLYLNVRYDGRLEAPADPTPPPAVRRTPMYARWWLWTAVGVGIAAAATAIAIPLSLREHACSASSGCGAISN